MLVAASAFGQGFQCTLLGTHDLHGSYNDVWGYVAPNGKEYALLGAQTGLVVIDCTIPTAPVERGFFPWATSTWRDIRTYGTYAYVSSEAGSGFMIVDLSNPDAPVNLGIFGSAQFGNAHNICVDVGAGRLYLAGCNTGTPVYDLAANPANPPFLGYALGSGNSNYFHDLCVENGYGYGSMIYNGVLRIWDVSTFPPTALSNSTTPSTFTHNAWPNAAGTVCVTTDERVGGLVRFFDVSNKAAPISRGQFTPNPASIPHNAYIIGNLCHISWYTEGYQCLDISDPTAPVQVAAYDTWPGASGGFNGAWGCYPFQPSGNVYVSDISNGLHIVRPHLTDLAITHAPLTDTTDELGPYTVVANVASSHAIQSVTLRWRVVGGGAFQAVAMVPTATPGQYAAAIPAQDAVTAIEYHIDAVDVQAQRTSPRVGEHRFLVGTRVSRWLDDFETSQPWTSGGTQNDWQLGAPQGRAGAVSNFGWQDPITVPSGSNVRGNDLGGSGFNGAYAASANNWLQSPSIPTNGVQGLRLRFKRWLTVATGDTARLLVNGNLIWSSSGTSYDTEWTWVEHDLAAITNTQAQVTVRFELQSGSSGNAGGWNLDDVELFTVHDAVPATSYGTGTPGTGGLVPQLALATPPVLGTNVQIDGSAMLANSVAVLALNLQPADFPALGVQVYIDPLNAVLLTGLISATGTSSWQLPMPASPALDGIYVYAQALSLDPGSPGGLFAASAGLRFRSALSAP